MNYIDTRFCIRFFLTKVVEGGRVADNTGGVGE